MGNIVELGGALIIDAGQRLEVTATNIANVTTPGYKSMVPFSTYLSQESVASDGVRPLPLLSRMDAGQYRQTDNPLDLAIQGDGLFVVRNEGSTIYTRAGQFHVDTDGRLVNAGGQALQGQGGDIVVRSANVEVLADGMVLDGGEPVARIDVVTLVEADAATRVGAGFMTGPDNVQEAETVRIGQGMLETSNVSMAHEMLAMMKLQRQAESGRHLVQAYDDLLGRVLTSFGQG